MAQTNEIARQLLRDYGLTYADLAHYSEVTERTVGRWVRDESNAPAKAILRAMTALGADPSKYGLRAPGTRPTITPASSQGVTLDELAAELGRIPQLEAEIRAMNHDIAELKLLMQQLARENA